ncbi:MAG: pyridoxal phosphate-dependent aminotransferase [Thermoprotei archaeon]
MSRAATTVPPYSIMEIAKYASDSNIEDLVYLNIGEPDFDTPENIRNAAVRAINQGKTHYTHDMGLIELRRAISEKLRVQNEAVYPASSIITVSGSQEGISVLCKSLVDPGDEVILSDPYYPAYLQNVGLSGGRPIFIPLSESKGYQMSAEDIEKAVTKKTKMIILVSPNNPTGGIQSEEELKRIAEIAEKNDLLVISDEIYEYLVYSGHKHVSIASFKGMNERTIVQNGFSKAYAMTGWRIGYMALPEPLVPKVEEVHRATVICPPSVSQYAALEALTGPQDSVRRMVEEFSKRRDFVVKRLSEIPDVTISPPSGAFYVFPDFSKYEPDDRKLALSLIKEAHVVTVNGSGFGELGRGHLRISFAASMDRLSLGLDRIESYLKRLKATQR